MAAGDRGASRATRAERLSQAGWLHRVGRFSRPSGHVAVSEQGFAVGLVRRSVEGWVGCLALVPLQAGFPVATDQRVTRCRTGPDCAPLEIACTR